MGVEVVTLMYSVDVDEHRVADGLALAELLMRDAFKFIAAYTPGSPGSAASIMAVFGDRILDDVRNLPQGGEVESMSVGRHPTEAERAEALMRSVLASRQRVQELLAENARRGGAGDSKTVN